MSKTTKKFEWPTLGLILACYGAWLLSVTLIAGWFLPLAVLLTTLSITLHSSLQHEVLHGHPFQNRRLNEALVWPPIGLAIPFERFRDLHLMHHKDANLTDPYDDPETGYLDPTVWETLPAWLRALLTFNNALLGRLLIGPLIGQVAFLISELRLIRAGSFSVLKIWLAHLLGAGVIVTGLWFYSTMPLWAYFLSAYLGLSILKIRTFLEHRAHDHTAARTVIIEDRGLLAFLFLNNNLHLVHHANPSVPWYELPQTYAQKAEHYQARNQGYCYRSYGAVFREFFLKTKEPVPHPHYRNEIAEGAKAP